VPQQKSLAVPHLVIPSLIPRVGLTSPVEGTHEQGSPRAATKQVPLDSVRVDDIGLDVRVGVAVRVAYIRLENLKLFRRALDGVHARETQGEEVRVQGVDRVAVGVRLVVGCDELRGNFLWEGKTTTDGDVVVTMSPRASTSSSS
jgi:hypothetical protein